MITVYTRDNGRVTAREITTGDSFPGHALWVDLFEPGDEERQFIAAALAVKLPDRDAMGAIEASSRLYSEGANAYLTIDVVITSDRPEPLVDALLIALTPTCLITMRYCEPRAIRIFADRLQHQPELLASAEDGILAFLDAITDRIADSLEQLGRDIDQLSHQVFCAPGPGTREKQLQEILQGVGRAGNIIHKMRAGIDGVDRLLTFLQPQLMPRLGTGQTVKFQALSRDVTSLADHAQFVAQETSFLLDATLGRINVEQNNILKIMSVVMVGFTPPTFFASLWGMNFHNMPEYNWAFGYPLAWGVMLVSAILPLLYFKRRGWF